MMRARMRTRKVLLLAVIFVLLIGLVQYGRPLPAMQATIVTSAPQVGQSITLPWPNYGQGALAAQGYGILQVSGEQKAVPMASITKVITAMAVLKQKPLAVGQQGPTIIINS